MQAPAILTALNQTPGFAGVGFVVALLILRCLADKMGGRRRKDARED